MITAIIQARMSSTRLPGKVMLRFSGNCLLGHIVERLSYSKHISGIVVATTVNAADDAIAEWADKNNIPYFRGSEADVLNRYYETAKNFGAQNIARITSDDPFKDPRIIDQVADLYFNEGLDFAYNNNPPSFAEGLDTEIFSFAALTRAEKDAITPFEREHVTQHFYKNPEKFKQSNLSSPVNYSHLRWTIDTSEDLQMTEAVYKNLYVPGKIFYAEDILRLLESKPQISTLNQSVKRSAMYNK
jgi:spore coat polysaccharide biosynthesis protein SpsF